MEGATIGQYRVTGVIGRGGMGAVYAAEHTLLGRPAAIKVLLPELSKNQDIVLRFFNEARAATAIRNPGIVEIYDFGWTPDGAAFIVMEHLEGETLARRRARGRFRWQHALTVTRQIAGALGAAHAKGIVHRDLKPDNVFLVLDPEVPGGERIKLLDFGIAKLAGESSPGMNVTVTGAVMGTPTYMSPEQCRGVAVDHRADLYALGCVLFELCCGRPVFVGEGSGDVLAAHIYMTPPTLASQGVEAPPAVEQLVQRLLAKVPAQRVQSAEDVIRAIDAAAAEPVRAAQVVSLVPHPVGVTPSTTTLSGAASTHPDMADGASRRHRRALAIVAGAAGAITVAVVVLLMGRGDRHVAAPDRPPPPIAAAVKDNPVVASTATTTPPGGTTPSVTAPSGGTTPSVTAPPGGTTTSATTPSAGAPPVATPPGDSGAQATAAATPPRPSPEPRDTPASTASTTVSDAHGAARSHPSTATKATEAEVGRSRPSAASSPAPRDAGTTRQSVAVSPPRVPPEASKPPAATRPPPLPAVVDVVIDSIPSGAEVTLAGKVAGKTPFHGSLPRRPGDVSLMLRRAGYSDYRGNVRSDRPTTETYKLVRKGDESLNPYR